MAENKEEFAGLQAEGPKQESPVLAEASFEAGLAVTKNPRFVEKTADQLKSQRRLADIYKSVNFFNWRGFDVPEGADNPSEFNEIIQREKETSRASQKQTELLAKYRDYLYVLKRIREQQEPQIKEELAKLSGSASRVEAYMRAVSFSGPLFEKILLGMQEGGSGRSLNKKFTDEQIEAAKKDENFAIDLINQALEHSPGSFLGMIEQAKFFLPKEKMRELADKNIEKNPLLFLSYFDRLAEYYEPHERKAVVAQAIEKEGSGAAVMHYFGKPKICELFGKDEAREIILSAAKEAYVSALQPEQIKLYIEKGFVDEKDIRQIVIHQIKSREDGIDLAKDFLQYFKSEEERNLLKSEVLNAFLRKEKSASIYGIEKALANFGEIDKDQVVRILRTQLEEKVSVAFNLDILFKYLAADEVNAFIEKKIKKKDFDLFSLPSKLLGSDLVRKELKDELMDLLINERPSEFFDSFRDLIALRPEEERKGLVVNLAGRARPAVVLRNIDLIMPYISDDAKTQKEFILNLIKEDKTISFVDVYGYSKEDWLLKKLFSKEEMRELLFKSLDLGAEDIFRADLKSIRDILGGDKELKSFIQNAAYNDPFGLFSHFGELNYLFSNDQAKEFIGNICVDERGGSAFIFSIDKLAPIVGADFACRFIEANKGKYLTDIMFKLENCLGFIPDDRKSEFLGELIRINPPLAISEVEGGRSALKRTLPDLDREKIAQIGQADQERIAFAPKTLLDFYKELPKLKDPSDINALFSQAAEIYFCISGIEKNGLSADYKKAQAAQALSGQKEEELIAIFNCFGILKEKHPDQFQELATLGGSLQESSQILFGELAKKLNLAAALLEDQRNNFFETMKTPAPFSTYLFQYESRKEYREILAGMFESIINKQFEEWKFDGKTEGEFARLKEKKSVPSALSFEQYALWKKDEESSLFETLSTDAQTLAGLIKKVLYENNEHLNIEAFAEPADESSAQILKEVNEVLAATGRRLAEINKRAAEIRKEMSAEAVKELADLTQEKEEVSQARSDLVKNKNFMRLANLKSKEIASGYFLEGEDLKKRSDKIENVLKEAEKMVPEEGRFVIQRVRQLMAEFKSQSGTKQNLTCEDSSSPRIMIEIGEKPVSSCQHYGHGSHNDCLLGYVDANTKILVLKNEKGNLVARSIFRLLADHEGKPALHIENIYTASASAGVENSIFAHAYRKAQSMGLPLFVSKEFTKRDQDDNLIAPAGFELGASDEILRSEISVAPKVYVDSAGGSRSRGNYVMNNLLSVKVQ